MGPTAQPYDLYITVCKEHLEPPVTIDTTWLDGPVGVTGWCMKKKLETLELLTRPLCQRERISSRKFVDEKRVHFVYGFSFYSCILMAIA